MTKMLNVNGVDIELTPSKTILENLELHSIAIEYHCRDGHCGACRARLVSGAVKYITEPFVYLRGNEILTCCTTIDESSKENLAILIK